MNKKPIGNEYYQYKEVVVKFDVTQKGQEVTPPKATVVVYDPQKEYVCKENAKIKGNEVSFALEGGRVERVGRYIFDFKVEIKGWGAFTHIVKVDVMKSPVPVKKK